MFHLVHWVACALCLLFYCCAVVLLCMYIALNTYVMVKFLLCSVVIMYRLVHFIEYSLRLSRMQSKKCVLWFLEATRTLMITGFAKRAPILHCFQDSETLIIFSCPSSSIPVSPTHLLLACLRRGTCLLYTYLDWLIHSFMVLNLWKGLWSQKSGRGLKSGSYNSIYNLFQTLYILTGRKSYFSLGILISSDYKSNTTNSYRQEVGWR